MPEEITAIEPAKPLARQERKNSPSRPLASTGIAPSPDPPTTHPHKGRLLDVIA